MLPPSSSFPFSFFFYFFFFFCLFSDSYSILYIFRWEFFRNTESDKYSHFSSSFHISLSRQYHGFNGCIFFICSAISFVSPVLRWQFYFIFTSSIRIKNAILIPRSILFNEVETCSSKRGKEIYKQYKAVSLWGKFIRPSP